MRKKKRPSPLPACFALALARPSAALSPQAGEAKPRPFLKGRHVTTLGSARPVKRSIWARSRAAAVTGARTSSSRRRASWDRGRSARDRRAASRLRCRCPRGGRRCAHRPSNTMRTPCARRHRAVDRIGVGEVVGSDRDGQRRRALVPGSVRQLRAQRLHQRGRRRRCRPPRSRGARRYSRPYRRQWSRTIASDRLRRRTARMLSQNSTAQRPSFSRT